MRLIRIGDLSVSSVVVTSAALILAGCSTAGDQQAGSTIPIPQLPAMFRDAGRPRTVRPNTISTKNVYVAAYDFFGSTNLIQIYQKSTFKKVGQIKQGINWPVDAWVDSHGLYVANATAGSITQYSSPKAKPFAYKAGIGLPVGVVTDFLGSVFEADRNGYVNEYPQHENVVATKCSVDGFPSGIAISTLGNVFVTYTSDYVGYILEFTDFSYCKRKVLGVRLGLQTGGMAIDKNNRLIVCDIANKTVDIIKPPYGKISSYLENYAIEPLDVKINAANTRAWIADDGYLAEVYYPGGKVIKEFSAYAYGAVDGSNYVP
jgi:hypothetical protein